jgi:hypothetical protein
MSEAKKPVQTVEFSQTLEREAVGGRYWFGPVPGWVQQMLSGRKSPFGAMLNCVDDKCTIEVVISVKVFL